MSEGPLPQVSPHLPATSDRRSGPSRRAHCYPALPGGGPVGGSARQHRLPPPLPGPLPTLAARSAWPRAASRSPVCATPPHRGGLCVHHLVCSSCLLIYKKALICGQLSRAVWLGVSGTDPRPKCRVRSQALPAIYAVTLELLTHARFLVCKMRWQQHLSGGYCELADGTHDATAARAGGTHMHWEERRDSCASFWPCPPCTR